MCTYSPFLSGRAQRNSLALRTDLSYLIASTEAAATTTTEGAPGPVPRTHPARQNSLSAETLQTLEKRLAQRPDRQELQDRNILKGTMVHRMLRNSCDAPNNNNDNRGW